MFLLLLCPKWRSSKYQLHSLRFDPTEAWTHDLFIVLGLTPQRLEPMIYHTWGEHVNHYTTDSLIYVINMKKIKFHKKTMHSSSIHWEFILICGQHFFLVWDKIMQMWQLYNIWQWTHVTTDTCDNGRMWQWTHVTTDTCDNYITFDNGHKVITDTKW